MIDRSLFSLLSAWILHFILLGSPLAFAQSPSGGSPALAAPASSPSNPDVEKRDIARRLLAVMGHDSLEEKEIASILATYEKKLPKVPADVWKTLPSKLNNRSLQEALVDIYCREFSLPELQSIMAFYQTEAGQKLSRLTPALGKAINQTVMEWRQALTSELHKHLNATVGE